MYRKDTTAILAAGGTGGHMFPAQMVAKALKEKGWKVLLVTDYRGKRHVKDSVFDEVQIIKASSLSFKRFWTLPVSIWKILSGLFSAQKLFKKNQIDIVIGFGGYPAFPALMLAQGLNIPFVLHEQNTILGRVNRFFAKKAKAILCGFKQLDLCPKSAKTVYTGNPVRKEILETRKIAYQIGDQKEDSFQILILGGSLGARILGEVLPKSILRLPKEVLKQLKIIQQTREENLKTARALYDEAKIEAVCEPFFINVNEYLATSQLVIARSGALTVTELMVIGRPSILIPLSIAMDDHQTANASVLMQANAASIVTERSLAIDRFAEILLTHISNPSKLAIQAENAKALGNINALDNMVEIIECVVQQHIKRK